MSDLARTLVANPRFRWMPGLSVGADGGAGNDWISGTDADGNVFVFGFWIDGDALREGRVVLANPTDVEPDQIPSAATLDPSDPATAGILLAMLYMESARVSLTMENIDGFTLVVHLNDESRRLPLQPHYTETFRGDDLGEACAKALIAVWA